MRILVTGGAGFIGSHLYDGLVETGHEVTVADNFSTGLLENIPDAGALVPVDVRDRAALPAVFEGLRPQIVFHLAAQMNVRRSVADAAEDADVNILGSLNVFRSAARSGVRRVIFASSGGAVYGDQPRYPCSEEEVPRPSSPYGIAKLSVEHYGRHFSQTSGLEFTALRLANVYGPRQNPRGEAGVVALFMNEMLASRAPMIFGNGGQTRDFVWVGDVVRAFLLSMEGRPGIYNIGTGKETTIGDLYTTLGRILGFDRSARRSTSCPGEVLRNAVSCERAGQVLGWRPAVSLNDGLERTAVCLGARPPSPR